MRLLERTLKNIFIAPREIVTDSLGGAAEGFSDQRRPVRASVIPSTGGIEDRETGLVNIQTMCLLLPMDADIAPGDGVCMDGGEPGWRCVAVQRWSAHIAAQAERIS